MTPVLAFIYCFLLFLILLALVVLLWARLISMACEGKKMLERYQMIQKHKRLNP